MRCNRFGWLVAGMVFFATPTAYAQDYTLVWSDEFDGSGAIDETKWGFENGFVRNNELQWYQKENAFRENGFLVIEGRKASRPNPNYVAGSGDWKKSREFIEYTSSSLRTRNRASWQYGRIEVRAKVTNAKGTWPAIWTLGTSCEWPSNGEVDIMENYGGKILANFAWGSNTRWKAKWDSSSKSVSSLGGSNWTSGFHVWRLDWDASRMSIYLDGKLRNDVKLSNTVNGSAKCPGQNPFRQPHYLLLNLALGSNGGGVGNLSFPTRYIVDYVRVYRKNVDYYYIEQKSTGHRLRSCDAPNGTTVEADVASNSGICVQWEKVPADNGFFFLRNRASGQYIRPNTSDDGSPIVVQPSSWTANWTQWDHVSTGDGFGYLKNRESGKHMYAAPDQGPGVGIELKPTSSQGANVRWRLVPADS